MKKNLIKTLNLKKPEPYFMHIDEIGFNDNNYKCDYIIKNNDYVKGIIDVVDFMTINWAPDNKDICFYEVAINILGNFDEIDYDKLIEHIKQIKKMR